MALTMHGVAGPITHPDQRKRSNHITPAIKRGPAVELAPVRGWLAAPSTDTLVFPAGESQAWVREEEAQAGLLRRAAHKRACHTAGHRRSTQCDECVARKCETCSLSAKERKAREDASGKPVACVRPFRYSQKGAAVLGGESPVRIVERPCWQRRCPSCPSDVCGECTGRCAMCDDERRKGSGASRFALYRDASALLEQAGYDPKTGRKGTDQGGETPVSAVPQESTTDTRDATLDSLERILGQLQTVAGLMVHLVNAGAK